MFFTSYRTGDAQLFEVSLDERRDPPIDARRADPSVLARRCIPMAKRSW